ncbi:LysM peptidoglycan-binding domain-containing protein [Cypionkella sinensis]|uniref:LysM peptidoglycan-binding domain-containing protein n=1 Tax=Cypionkella sinensis TaxID=1756043 RepID=A0ABV7IX46_9RHOB
MSASARGVVLAGGAAVLAVLGYFGFARGPEPAAPVLDQSAVSAQGPVATPSAQLATAADAPTSVAGSDAAATAPVAEAAPATASDDSAATASSAPAQAAAILPRFDVARVAPDGAATVAGAAAPGATVSLLVDGVAVATAVADKQGKFAALFDLPASAAAQVLTLQAVGADGVAVTGAEKIALAPIAGDPAVEVATAADAAEPALQAPAAVLIAPEGVKVLQPGAEEPVELSENVVVDTISYAPDGAVMLGGRASAGAALRIYLDGAAIADIAAGPDGAWATTLKDVAAGIYTLRVDQLAEDGTVTSRFETPFKRETLEALAAATTSTSGAPDATASASDTTAPATAAPAPLAAENPAPDTAASAAEADVAASPAPAPSNVSGAEATAPADAPAPQPATATDPAPTQSTTAPAEAAPAPIQSASAAPPAPVSVTVQPGYTLWGIAQQNFGEGVMYVQVFEANKAKIKDPNLIYPGQVFTIPVLP